VHGVHEWYIDGVRVPRVDEVTRIVRIRNRDLLYGGVDVRKGR
jgi:hypothetical protein